MGEKGAVYLGFTEVTFKCCRSSELWMQSTPRCSPQRWGGPSRSRDPGSGSALREKQGTVGTEEGDGGDWKSRKTRVLQATAEEEG